MNKLLDDPTLLHPNNVHCLEFKEKFKKFFEVIFSEACPFWAQLQLVEWFLSGVSILIKYIKITILGVDLNLFACV